MPTEQKHRKGVKRRLAEIQKRLRHLFSAERRRDAVTKRRRKKYLAARKQLGERDPRTLIALRNYRASAKLSRKIDETEEILRKRAEKKIAWLKDHPPKLDADGDGLIQIDGKQVATAVGKEVLRIRAGGRWKGFVVSGYRTPEHSEQLCMNMCGAPRCPGLCAGRSTNHARKGGRNGAVDLTDFLTFAAECNRLDSWLENHLPRDLVHFSDVGV
ncbi:MAG TPA: hypothetical protein VIS51_04300 [Solirubrobacterales bacterium]